MTNKEKLVEAIKSSGFKVEYIAERLGITTRTWYRKLNGLDVFRQDEIGTLMRLLKLTPSQTRAIFFAKAVDRKSTKKATEE